MTRIKLRVPHSILFVFDPANPDVVIPEYNPRSLVGANNSCIAVATTPEFDGETMIAFLAEGQKALHPLVYSGVLDTPSGRAAVNSSEADSLLDAAVGTLQAHVRIYANSTSSPSEILIAVSPREV